MPVILDAGLQAGYLEQRCYFFTPFSLLRPFGRRYTVTCEAPSCYSDCPVATFGGDDRLSLLEISPPFPNGPVPAVAPGRRAAGLVSHTTHRHHYGRHEDRADDDEKPDPIPVIDPPLFHPALPLCVLASRRSQGEIEASERLLATVYDCSACATSASFVETETGRTPRFRAAPLPTYCA